MKEIKDIFKLFSDYGLNHKDVIQFCQLVLKDKRKSVDKIEKYDAILESLLDHLKTFLCFYYCYE